MVTNWLKISLLALKTEGNILEFNKNIFKFKLFKFRGSTNGYMMIWNVKTLHAFTISRMEINETIVGEVNEIDMAIEYNDSNFKTLYDIPHDLIFENSKPY
ncbi:hypothetical protein [Flavobacterium sp. HNIBRBA15423]|uniref:hypothetical protein n=1 Tax=Flavobacterium sp. HNIBRBA15423 TaxID=3458683 RepID=UPI00404398B6